MGLVTLPYVWVARELVPAAYLNADFNAILNQVNGNLDATNLANLAVTAAKLGNLAVTGPKIGMGSDAWGDVLFRGATVYQRLAAGTSGYVLETLGNTADPVWVDPTTIGALIKIATSSPVAQTTVPITGLLPNKKYKVIVRRTQNTAVGFLGVQFNGDTTGNYQWGASLGGAAQVSYGGGSGANMIYIEGVNASATENSLFEFTFSTAPGNNHKVYLTGHSIHTDGYYACTFGGKYSGGADLSQINLLVSGGTFTGTIDIYQFA